MKTSTSRSAFLGLIAAAFLACVGGVSRSQQPEKSDKPAADKPAAGVPDMAAMMAKAKKFTEPGEEHKLLEKFVGKWETETRFFMGGKASPAEKGTAEGKWLMPGRWLQSESKGTMMRMPFHSVTTMGYDRFKMSYVMTVVSSMDTAMTRYEGDLDPGGKALLAYGTLDEYLTGEHDKMVKIVFRFLSDDKMVMEIHDLPIGENNTKVVEVTYARQK